MSLPAIAVTDLTKRFGKRVVVDRVSITVQPGEIVGFLGPNGSGKTTTIRMMCGLLTPDAGEGRVLGHDILRDQAAIKREVGYMTQRFSFYEDLTIAENLGFVAGVYGLPADAVTETLADLGLTSRRAQLAGSLSGGWKQRLALAACLMHRPKLLMLDEPTAGVDPKARRDFWDEIHARAATGLTVLVSTHYMDEAERCHRINYISYGKLISQGTVAEVIAAAGLVTVILRGPRTAEAQALLLNRPGVDQVAHWGADLHVIGRDGAALRQAAAEVAAATGASMIAAETSLEDVFIQLMGAARDNMA
ncbi:ABC transporter ATP-binding protein [Rhodobacter capsulatus]|jgi:ABC-2 type transport system ATP-binding protein|uniref:ABC transporter, ATP-binding protein n=1 Tax=Rhodobacter capsulatus (strain ATCC BAA-309 / NBRC 16581 / SB1003) TaxID=272942 RepID=D5AKD5_RHOCB|nr:ABC transporter ATP-binding protein [Rhodobacter capsulatus]ADE83777.1 ABC transporter, ATP-binding protein [Rhodobacter capsulatus SB 1003]ETD03493.1 multidrug ABC transporter ATP-binding protein [Rhodobacter capsulatus DE442]ETD80286.1 multidrug ABC transporter ATP-binding protein [Rhodobacter capsulatus R121]ETE55553.1 multidrug ABC transporter ATP-binding protein [Rhodobacter capsulatus Y262]MDS0925367.1 ABC transporter ATP-binding protein [Rhodobacter capsulatus]